MDILNYTDDHNEFRDRLRAFLEKEITPFGDQWEKDGLVPKEAWRKMGQAGFLCPLHRRIEQLLRRIACIHHDDQAHESAGEPRVLILAACEHVGADEQIDG